MMSTTTSGFAKFPDLKNFNHDVQFTDLNEKTYVHKRNDCIQLYPTKENSVVSYEGFDKVTKCYFNVVIDPEPICTIRDDEKNVFFSISCKEIHPNGLKCLLFNFRNNDRLHRFTFYTCESLNLGMFQSFE